jgi:hypothetical protein
VTTPVFGLRKTWLDPGPGIAMVQVHYTTSPGGAAPDWADAEQVVLAPHGGPRRSAVLEVPRADLSLHHFFFVVGVNDRTASPVFTEDIVAHEVTYEDPTGECTAVGVVWSVVDEDLPNYTSTVMDGLPFASMGAFPDDGSVYEFVRAQPLPHAFRGRVWGVRGSSIRYGYHLIHHGQPDPADNTERWDDNGGAGWTVEL